MLLKKIYVTISISNLIILPVNIIWKKNVHICLKDQIYQYHIWAHCMDLDLCLPYLCVYISLFNLQIPSLVYINVHEYYLTLSSFLYTCSQFATFTFINIYVKIQLYKGPSTPGKSCKKCDTKPFSGFELLHFYESVFPLIRESISEAIKRKLSNRD
jgi:hypothetical protein